jgi:uncharacterized membrane protein
MDLEIAAGIDPSAEPAIAIDAIDEYLSNIEKVAKHAPELSQLRGHGETLAFRIDDNETLWSVTFNDDGFDLSRAEGTFDAELVGSPVDLLLAVLRRRGADQGDLEVRGERRLVDFWLAHSPFD